MSMLLGVGSTFTDRRHKVTVTAITPRGVEVKRVNGVVCHVAFNKLPKIYR